MVTMALLLPPAPCQLTAFTSPAITPTHLCVPASSLTWDAGHNLRSSSGSQPCLSIRFRSPLLPQDVLGNSNLIVTCSCFLNHSPLLIFIKYRQSKMTRCCFHIFLSCCFPYTYSKAPKRVASSQSFHCFSNSTQPG